MNNYVTSTNVGEHGQFILPKEFRETNHLEPGDPITVIQVGSQMILVSTQCQFTEITEIADSLSSKLEQAGITEEVLQEGLAETREEITRERYPELFLDR
jgi:bifunctional DNA-binding transcriptional regulator/antitoxin component of YhaV-PrlF toxin-antitoxin module